MKNNRSSFQSRSNRGFTLMEVMVAVLIVGVTLGVLLRASSDTLSKASYLRNITMAQWVAENKLAELRLRHSPLPRNRASGQTKMLNRTWAWQLQIKSTPDANVKQLTIAVSLQQDNKKEDNQPLAIINSFLYNPN